MALKIDLHPAGPGSARLLIGGARPSPETVSLALQRNDGRYLGLDRQWQVTPHWHPIFTAEPLSDGLRLTLGADLVDSIVGVGGAPLRVVARLDGVEDAGTLRIRGELIGSGAAASRSASEDPLEETISIRRPGAESTRDAEPDSDADDFSLDLEGHADPRPTPRPAARWPWLALAAVLLLAGVGVGAWWLGWFDETLPSDPDTPLVVEPPPDFPPAQVDTPESEQSDETAPPSERDPTLTGIALASRFLADGPTPAAIFERAEQLEQTGDCPAAYALYSEAANTDPAFAARLARRYDPLTHRPGTCIAAPDIPYAIVYYSDAAEAGDTEVQRRLGQLMAEHESSGPTHEAGLGWLRKAAAAGDAEAARAIESLGGGR
ncbi:SEL1-like repeat protein [Thiocapsa marina]|uniref:Sel1 domain protein repeat-containing protein n=1 Tax=Thiocapsa marina 5811 TaxID=768671 RepID=F9UEA8_9GAMM|nr:sel1 repeat family protein [Thiocapsa marina]EGV17229.1 Sel1 domain protein repeat-containing protein [Thiocapsa marina 5811]